MSNLTVQPDQCGELHLRDDDFLAVLSHELRNSLSLILTAVQMLRLQASEESPHQQQAHNVIERQVGQMDRLLADLMDISRSTTGSMLLDCKNILMDDVVARAVEATESIFDERQQELTLSLPALPIQLHADPDRMEKVVVNLLTNAARHTEMGGQIWLSVQENNETVELRIRDSSSGISPDQLPLTFDLFLHTDQSTGRSVDGFNIDLSLAQRLVQLHGGIIKVESVLGKGSEFLVSMPAIKASASDVFLTPIQKEIPDDRRCRLLVIEDNVDGAMMQQALLEALGHDVKIAHDGHAGLEAALEFMPDVIFLDMGLPDMSGYQVAKAIRQQPVFRDVLLVAVTGHGLDADRQRTLEAGCDHHLMKPTSFNEVQRILRSLPCRMTDE